MDLRNSNGWAKVSVMATPRYSGWLILLIGWVALVVGCSTPASRIQEKSDRFYSFPEEVQEKVRIGQVEVGYDYDMVYIAKGKPDRKYVRKTASGETEVWSYTRTEYWTDRQRVTGRFRVHDADGRSRTVTDSAWVDVRNEREFEQERVEFENGGVKSYEVLLTD